jgi:5S rRNA maturation endonuclease (ribonuclease M5)
MIHPYRDRKGKLIKQVLRYPDRRFKVRRPAGGDWKWNIDGIPPMLYNLDMFQFADTIVICEGERDADSLMRLQLLTQCGNLLVATTSGSANSWVDSLADDFCDKKVIVMPDADDAGANYAKQIIESLDKRQIRYQVVSFAKVEGVKDVSDFLLTRDKEALVEYLDSDWLERSSKQHLPEDASAYSAEPWLEI